MKNTSFKLAVKHNSDIISNLLNISTSESNRIAKKSLFYQDDFFSFKSNRFTKQRNKNHKLNIDWSGKNIISVPFVYNIVIALIETLIKSKTKVIFLETPRIKNTFNNFNNGAFQLLNVTNILNLLNQKDTCSDVCIIVFSDNYIGSEGTNAEVSFLGQPFYFSSFENLLVNKFAFSSYVLEKSIDLKLIRIPQDSHLFEQEIAKSIEFQILQFPEQVLDWVSINAKSVESTNRLKKMVASVVESYCLEGWKKTQNSKYIDLLVTLNTSRSQ